MKPKDVTLKTTSAITNWTSGVERFLNIVRTYKPLNADEEAELTSEYTATTDEKRKQEIKEKIVLSNLRLIYAVAKRHSSSPETIMDLTTEGVIGMMKAFDGFDFTRGIRFTTYASWWVKKYMSNYIYESSLVKRPTDMKFMSKANEIREAIFANENGRIAEDDEVMKILNEKYGFNIKKKDVISKISVESVNSSMKDDSTDEKYTLLDSKEFNDETCSMNGIVEQMEKEDMKRKVSNVLSVLNARDRDIVCMIMGIGYENEISAEDVAEKYNTSATRVRQIYKNSINKMKKCKFMLTA